MELFMGVDIGGTETKMGLFSKEGELPGKMGVSYESSRCRKPYYSGRGKGSPGRNEATSL